MAELQKSLYRKLPREAYLEAQLSIHHIAAIQESILEVKSAIDGQAWYHHDLKRLMQVPGIGRDSKYFKRARQVLDFSDHRLITTTKNLIEFLVVVTKPVG